MNGSLFADGSAFLLTLKLIAGAGASFFAIMSWSRTRSLSWTFVILGILSLYAGTLYQTLIAFGLLTGRAFVISGVGLGTIVSEILPLLFFSIAALLRILSRR
jgi:hypothetical protein